MEGYAGLLKMKFFASQQVWAASTEDICSSLAHLLTKTGNHAIHSLSTTEFNTKKADIGQECNTRPNLQHPRLDRSPDSGPFHPLDR